MQYVIRDASEDAISRVETSLTNLLGVIASSNSCLSVAPNLSSVAMNCFGWIDEQDFNDFNDSVVKQELSKFELKFRKIKNGLEKELNIVN